MGRFQPRRRWRSVAFVELFQLRAQHGVRHARVRTMSYCLVVVIVVTVLLTTDDRHTDECLVDCES